MNITDAIYEYAKSEVIPKIAGESQLTAGILNGLLKAGKKKIALKISDNSMLKSIGMIQEDGEINAETLKDFFDGVFENRDTLPITLAELLKTATGISSDNELLQGTIKITRADADRIIELLGK